MVSGSERASRTLRPELPETGDCSWVVFEYSDAKQYRNSASRIIVVEDLPMRNSALSKRAPRLCSIVCACLLAGMRAEAANGTWTNPNGGSWTNGANWSGSVIADGFGNSANFGTLSLPGDAIVTLDAPRTIGSLIFDDQNTTKHNWIINSGAGGANQLTLAGGTPSITAGSATIINAVIVGTNGLTKGG